MYFLFLSLLFFSQSLLSMESAVLASTDIYSFESLKRSEEALPFDVATKARAWFADHSDLGLKMIAQKRFQQPAALSIDYENLTQAHNQLLMQAHIHNKSQYNYVFTLPVDRRYLIKISGIMRRVANYLASYASTFEHAKKLYSEYARFSGLKIAERYNIQEYMKQHPETYQTISSVASYRRAQEVIARYDLKSYKLPLTAYISLTGGVSDKEGFVVQERLEGFASLEKNADVRRSLTYQHLFDTCMLIKHAGLWDLQANILYTYDLLENCILLSIADFEQYPLTKSSHFFLKDPEEYARCVRNGFFTLKRLFMQEPHQLQAIEDIQKAIASDI